MQKRYVILLALAGLQLTGNVVFAQSSGDALAGLPKTPAAKAGQTEVNSIDGLTYVWISPGKFMMGCSSGDTECDRDEKPIHPVTIGRGFWMGQTPVTQQAYQRVTGKSPGYFKGAQFPVESVNWDEAQTYCQATGLRLPTEAEWEYGARAGSTSGRYGDIDQIAWYGVNSENKMHEVMRKQPNAWNLYDVLGEVWEWTADWYAAYKEGSVNDPQGPASGKIRVLRGGSWGNGPAFVRVSVRSGNEPENHSNVVGFRCAGN
jgi:formylglycine-generating enzyme required for sulfatase activity